MMKVVHLSAECFPIAKVGGLADVIGALPKFQRAAEIDASVVMPFYDRDFVHKNEFEIVAEDRFYQGSQLLSYTILKEKNDVLGFPLYLIKIPGKLDRPKIYGYRDEPEQWIAFQHAFLHWMKYHEKDRPDIFHCHDSHTGLIPFLAKHSYEFDVFKEVKCIFTVHNGQYQGWMDWNKSSLLPDYDTWKWGLLDWGGVINPVATAIKSCDAFTAVSEGYLHELYEKANGLEDLFSHERAKGFGIVNGIDTSVWNPHTDEYLVKKYKLKTVNQGKKDNKRALCKEYGLPPNLPLITFIGRFASEKGADLLNEIVLKLFYRNPERFTIFILGSGDAMVEQEINILQGHFTKHMGVYIGYNEGLAHRLYAASDMLLMPSRVEPCGLNQLYALKYGTIPIVRGIGGLKETVRDADVETDDGYGYVFENANIDEAVHAVERALERFSTKRQWSLIRSRAMRQDFSWDNSAKKYIDLYQQLLKN